MDHAFDVYSDTFKDVNGFRPRGRLADRFLKATLAEQDAMLEALFDEIAEQIKEDRQEMMRQAPVDTRSPLEKALDADTTPEHDIPAIRRNADVRPGTRGYQQRRDQNIMSRFCACTKCGGGRTWKRFRAAQYRAVKIA